MQQVPDPPIRYHWYVTAGLTLLIAATVAFCVIGWITTTPDEPAVYTPGPEASFASTV